MMCFIVKIAGNMGSLVQRAAFPAERQGGESSEDELKRPSALAPQLNVNTLSITTSPSPSVV